MTLANDFAHAVTRYDRKQASRKGYNVYALGIYLARCDEVVADVEAGTDIRTAICGAFNDRLRDSVLRYLGLPLTADPITTCIEHAYGSTQRLSFQIKVF